MDCDEEREGYLKPAAAAYPAIHTAVGATAKQHTLSTRVQEGIGALIAIAGGFWAVYVVTIQQASPWHFQIVPPAPGDVCALGALVWLHAKWRQASRMR